MAAFTDRVPFVKRPPVDQRDVHHAEVIGTDDPHARHRQRRRVGRRHAFDGERRRKTSGPHRYALNDGRVGHARIGLHRVHDVPREHDVVLPLELVVRQRNRHGEDVVRIEPGRDGEEVRGAPQQQPGADEKHHRQRHLRCDEQVERAILSMSGAWPPCVE